MSISSQSQLTGYHSKRSRGFSLVELLVSIAIIGMLTSIVLINFTDFDSTTILKGVAYEVAGTVREAQVLSISVLGADNSFQRTYGVFFKDESSDYTVFSDTEIANPRYDNLARSTVSAITTYTMMRGITVEEICVSYSNSTDPNCDVDELSISFRRPEFASLYYLKGAGGTPMSSTGIKSVTIKLQSDKGGNMWNVSVGALGHISVTKEPD